eukprot:911349-Pleurochrysis_carterae.AAC.1
MRRNRAVIVWRDLQLLLGRTPLRYLSASRWHRLEHANEGLCAGEDDVMHVSIRVLQSEVRVVDVLKLLLKPSDLELIEALVRKDALHVARAGQRFRHVTDAPAAMTDEHVDEPANVLALGFGDLEVSRAKILQ